MLGMPKVISALSAGRGAALSPQQIEVLGADLHLTSMRGHHMENSLEGAAGGNPCRAGHAGQCWAQQGQLLPSGLPEVMSTGFMFCSSY